ncbi:SOS response-associated peptidase [Microlunatus soli]|uniref:Abasic site processing protein n=1 Tax=Microlunatus soli TaxID=630515 RepID=A0A1H1MJQ1_9ACTN|nr:SOS response-associated peptidase [Microlunatus soli]SDR86605.1 Putative SOS response-associated peptidase YedK [Microlunatus soli]
MCGRYASSATPEELAEEFDVDDILGDLPEPDYNVAPTVEVPAILERTDKESDTIRRRLTPLVWGLVPSWSKGPGGGAKMINARFETVASKPAFKRACSVRRCLLPADGYYEWYDPQSPEPVEGSTRRNAKPRKQPFFIHRSDGDRLVMAGLYEYWRDPAKDPDDDSAWLRTCTVITTSATDALGHIHDRMPMVVPADRWAGWLDPKLTDPEAARQLLTVTDADQLEAYAVSALVSNVKNNGPELLQPLAESAETTSAEATTEDTLF